MRLRVNITGIVQGVGFRPFVFRLAQELSIKGYVLNETAGVLIEAEGEKERLDTFLIRIDKEKPGISEIFSLQYSFLEEIGFDKFEIRKSADKGDKTAVILPDIMRLRRMSGGDKGSPGQTVSVRLHKLHTLWSTLYDHTLTPLRQEEDFNEGFPDVP